MRAALPAGGCRRQEGYLRRRQGSGQPRCRRATDRRHRHAEPAGRRSPGAGRGRARRRPAQPRLHRDPRADRRRGRQPQRSGRLLRHDRRRAHRPRAGGWLWVDANFKESQLAQMRPGQSVGIVADVLPDETFTGHVESLAPATGAQFSVLPPENATGNFTKIVQRVPVRIRLDGDGGRLGRLRPGLSVTASVDRRGGSPRSDTPDAGAAVVVGALGR
ncbi:HlyD family secretion protein [Methylobacterium aquaticum]|uniref:HlyD family secretion protein n=1 Tax=Methylobacterium aquaticum TaxID=270351 RepID=UPI003CCA5D17